ncbi:MAG TPA: hypothetical protein VIV66_22605, partial [Pyrinomonadaceae bacterium]
KHDIAPSVCLANPNGATVGAGKIRLILGSGAYVTVYVLLRVRVINSIAQVIPSVRENPRTAFHTLFSSELSLGMEVVSVKMQLDRI